MEEEVSLELREKISQNVDKVFEKWLNKVSKGESIEGIIKGLIVEKVMNIMGALMKRTIAKKVAKIAVRKAVDKYWKKNHESISEIIKNL